MDGPIGDFGGFETEALAEASRAHRQRYRGGRSGRRGDADLAQGRDRAGQRPIGRRNIETGAPMARDTLFRIASMTKPITSVAALMLMEEGKLSLNDPITKWAPEFADMRVLKDGRRPAGRDLSRAARHHRRGPADPPRGPGLWLHLGRSRSPTPTRRRWATCSTADMTPDAWMAALGGLPLVLSARRAVPLQPRHRRAGLPGRPRRGHGRSATC